MTLSDVYCRFNRARGMEVGKSSRQPSMSLNSGTDDMSSAFCTLRSCYRKGHFIFTLILSFIAVFQLVSPDDLVNAAKLFSSVNMPLR